MESRKNDGRDGGDAVDAWQGVQHLDMPDLDIPNLGEITSTFEPVTDVAPPHADASALVASPIPSVSDSAESVTRGGASSAGVGPILPNRTLWLPRMPPLPHRARRRSRRRSPPSPRNRVCPRRR